MVCVGQDLRWEEAMLLGKWWRRKGEIILSVAPKRSPRGNIVYDVFMKKRE